MKIGEKNYSNKSIGQKENIGRKIGTKQLGLNDAVQNQTRTVVDPEVKKEIMNRK